MSLLNVLVYDKYTIYETFHNIDKLDEIKNEINSNIGDYERIHEEIEELGYGQKDSFPILPYKNRHEVLKDDLQIMMTQHTTTYMAVLVTIGTLFVSSLYILVKY